MLSKNEIKGHASMLSANIMWGLMSPFVKLAILSGMVTPLIITNLRIVGAMVLFWITSFFQPKENVPFKDLVRLFGAALLAIVFNQGCFIYGVGLSSPMDASIITTSMPLWAMLLAAIILKEPISTLKVGGIIIGAAGALLLICGSNHVAESGNNYLLGNLLVMTAQISYSFYLVGFKNFVNKYSLVTVMKWMFTFATICVVPFSYEQIIETKWTELPWYVIGAIVFTVVGATYFAYSLIVVGQKNLRPTVAGMYNYFQPIVACLVAVILGMDSFTPMKVLAVLLIFSGVFLVTKSKRRNNEDKE